ncbi:MAG: hypothetical protein M3340_05105 [Actinomycetota bacterium]|nr:hypothetical protein [Actinomycetota bacterium]
MARDPRTPGRTRLLRLLAPVLALVSLLALAPPAAADRSPQVRYSTIARGDVKYVANTLLTCPGNGGACRNAKDGSDATATNNAFTMTYVDADADATTFNSSSASLSLPAGATVLFAGLYWGADTTAGAGGAAAPNPAAAGTVKLKAPGSAAYSTVTATTLDTDSARTSRFQGFADVTTQVLAAGTGTYTVADLQAGTGEDRYGGWSLAIAYRDTTQAVHWLGIYDGFVSLRAPGNPAQDLTLTGFQAPPTGTVNAALGLVSYEGDLGITGDTADLDGTQLVDAVHPSGNAAESVIGAYGSHVTTKSPHYVNQLGYDAAIFDADGILTNDQTSTTLHLTTTLDVYLPGVISLVIDQTASLPANTSLPTISGTPQDGRVLTANPGTWSGTTPMTFDYQWRRCNAAGASCVDISGATSQTYTAQTADIGSTVRVFVTATNVVGSGTATSAQVGAVTPAPPENTALPAISGTTQDGQVLTSTTGTWTGTPTITYARQWRRCDASGASCSDIAGATGTTYSLTPSDVGSTIRVRVTGTNGTGSANASSDQTAVVTAIPPANTVLPAVSGTARDGEVLSASTGTWTGTPAISHSYQWRRCNTGGASCSDIAGATGSTYTAVAADVGATVRVVVTGTNAGGSAPATSAQTAVVAAAPPASTGSPSISGTAREGQTLTAAPGTWSGTSPIAFTHQWRRCDASGASCTNIGGATGSTYVLTAADIGATVRVVVTGTNAGGSAPATSSQTAAVAALPPASTAPPTISGTPRDGQTLTASTGTWTSGAAPVTHAYRWRRCNASGASCSDIAGATASTYAAVPADIGSTLRVAVTATNSGGSSTATSSQTGLVAAIPPANTALPSVSGTPKAGHVLTSTTGTWTGSPAISYSRQWRRCDASGAACADIPGATGTTYELTNADVGSTVRVAVTGTNAGGSAGAASARTAVVEDSPPVLGGGGGPSISGSPVEGGTLIVDPGDWGGTTPVTYTYQWRRCDAGGANCTDIPGATGSSYTLGSGDVGHTIVVVVTATNPFGSESAASGATGRVEPEPEPPVNTTPPSVGGDPDSGGPLTANPGQWTGGGGDPSYQWERCDASGGNCTAIPGATGPTYTPTKEDEGQTIRVIVVVTNPEGSTRVVSEPIGPIDVPGEQRPADERPADERPADEQPVDDLGTIGESLVGPDSCTRIAAGTGVRRKRLTGFGTVKVLLRASAYVSPESPLRMSTSASQGRIKAVRYVLDGRTVGQPKRKPYWQDVTPAALAVSGSDTHSLKVVLVPRKGRSATFSFDVKTRPCDNLLSARQWKTVKGTGLRLRVDSRAALGPVTFKVPSAMLPKTRDAGKGVGRVRYFTRTTRQPFTLSMTKQAPTVLLAGEGRPRVELIRGGAVVSNLPAGVGIVELTLYTQKATSPRALLAKGKKARVSAATTAGGASVRLNATLVGGAR